MNKIVVHNIRSEEKLMPITKFKEIAKEIATSKQTKTKYGIKFKQIY